MDHRLQQFLPFGRIIDLGEFLRQIQVIPADDAILDEPLAGFGHLVVFLLRLQEFTWIADRDPTKGGSTGAMIAKENERLSRSSLTTIPIGELEARFDYITVCTPHLFRSEGLARSNPLFSASARSRDSHSYRLRHWRMTTRWRLGSSVIHDFWTAAE